MNLQYENQDNDTFLVAELEMDMEIDPLTLGMITNNTIYGLAHAVYFQVDEKRYVKYNVSSQITLRQYLEGTVCKKRLLDCLEKVVNAILQSEEYMIDSNSILLNPNFMFIAAASRIISLICIPVLSFRQDTVDFREFVKGIMMTIKFDDTEDCDYIARLLNYLNQYSVFSFQSFKKLLEELRYPEYVQAVQNSIQNEKTKKDGSFEQPVDFGESIREDEADSNISDGELLVSQLPQKQKVLIRLKNHERILINKSQFKIGKASTYADYCVTDNPAVSRSHANIIIREEMYFIMDTNSKNHTYVNGQMIPSNVETRILPGTRLRLANEDFEFQVHEQ